MLVTLCRVTTLLPLLLLLLQVNGRIMRKRIHVRIEHIQPSRCREDFLRRRETNDRIKHEAKVKGGAYSVLAVGEAVGWGPVWGGQFGGGDEEIPAAGSNVAVVAHGAASRASPVVLCCCVPPQRSPPAQSACPRAPVAASPWRMSRWRPSLPSPTISSRKACSNQRAANFAGLGAGAAPAGAASIAWCVSDGGGAGGFGSSSSSCGWWWCNSRDGRRLVVQPSWLAVLVVRAGGVGLQQRQQCLWPWQQQLQEQSPRLGCMLGVGA